MRMRITISQADQVEALKKERAVAHCHDELHLAQNDVQRFVAHMRALYHVPPDYTLTNWLLGFEPPGEEENGEADEQGSE